MEGKAQLLCKFNNFSITFRNPDKKSIGYLNHQKCSDAIIFERIQAEQWVLHIIEFKRTVTKNKWDDTKAQFKGAILQASACMGLLGISNVVAIKCYTALRNDKINTTTDPFLLKTLVGQDDANSCADWLTNKIKLDILPKRIAHQKIILNVDTGYGEFIFS